MQIAYVDESSFTLSDTGETQQINYPSWTQSGLSLM